MMSGVQSERRGDEGGCESSDVEIYHALFSALNEDYNIGDCPEGMMERIRIVTRTYYKKDIFNLRGKVWQTAKNFQRGRVES